MMTNRKLLYGIAGILVAVSIGTSLYFYLKYRTLAIQYRALAQPSQPSARAEADQLIARLGRLILLPTGEQPTVATVVDPEKLRDQPFFTNAQKGDKVLIYTNAGKAVLYNPAEDKIVEVAPITIGQAPQPTASSSPTSTTPAPTTRKRSR